MMPFNLSVFFSTKLIVRFYHKLTPQKIGRYGFIICTLSLLWLAFVVRNNWSEFAVLFGLVAFGIGQGSLVTLLFNVLVSASPKELAGDVGSLRGTTNNLANAIGTAGGGCVVSWAAQLQRYAQHCANAGAHTRHSGAGESG